MRSLALIVIATALFGASDLRGQSTPPVAALPIRDNSFLIEEAYNQEWGVVQHVGTFQKVRGSSAWGATFTQEWPAPGERHQLSYTVPVLRTTGPAGSSVGIGDVALNYRYQVPMRDGSPVAFAPRASLSLPVGDEASGRGERHPGVEINLPVSVEIGRKLVTHVNAGLAWGDGDSPVAPGEAFIGQSLILLLHPRFNLMVEGLWSGEISCNEPLTGGNCGDKTFVLAPGFRAAIDFPSGLQVVPGLAFPIGLGSNDDEDGIYLYLSFEHPFRRR